MDTEKTPLHHNIEKIHSTALGLKRIASNRGLDEDDVLDWCKEAIVDQYASLTRNGKNWYLWRDDCIITINAQSYTIITAHTRKSVEGKATYKKRAERKSGERQRK
jgi:hypothetical protein